MWGRAPFFRAPAPTVGGQNDHDRLGIPQHHRVTGGCRSPTRDSKKHARELAVERAWTSTHEGWREDPVSPLRISGVPGSPDPELNV